MSILKMIKDDKMGKYDFSFNYDSKNGITEIFHPSTGYVLLSTEHFKNGEEPEVCGLEFSELSKSQRVELAKTLIDLTYLYRYGGVIRGKINNLDISRHINLDQILK